MRLVQPFCSNPACVLHMRPDDRRIEGSGECAVRPDGIVTSRGVHLASTYKLDHVCAQQPNAAEVVREDGSDRGWW